TLWRIDQPELSGVARPPSRRGRLMETAARRPHPVGGPPRELGMVATWNSSGGWGGVVGRAGGHSAVPSPGPPAGPGEGTETPESSSASTGQTIWPLPSAARAVAS